ncbi:MAG: hypothetical protein COA96_10965 [SAR86 cluster bacterium]|uniref:Uncharacterized protein n=1 Tax=SAR86 cluster bacterium TaxID=2030880 RepID=A0A2A5AYL8_9GAMM|nr:MAG: hypothetical protein COA96_10965 [SAR86 cluster bacterium]
MPKLLSNFLFSALLFLACASSFGQESSSSQWNGAWIAEGTLFQIGVEVEDGVFKVTQIESLGFEWTNENGTVDGNVITVKVEYAGVTGVIQAELINDTTAVAFVSSCLPEYMVVCALSKDRQAVFRKVESN